MGKITREQLSVGFNSELDGINTQLSEKANKIDLDNTNTNVSLNANEINTAKYGFDSLDARFNSIESGIKADFCKIKLSTNQSIPPVAQTKISFDTKVEDTNNLFSSSDNGIKVVKSGTYLVSANVSFDLKGIGCTISGVCGKTPEVANMQDLLLFVVRGVAVYNQELRKEGKASAEADKFVFDGLFTTITNANFDNAAIIAKIKTVLS